MQKKQNNQMISNTENFVLKHEENYIDNIEILHSDHITLNQIQLILSTKKFVDFIKEFDKKNIIIRNLKILNIFMFGNKIGFIDLELDCSLKNHLNFKLQGFVFLS